MDLMILFAISLWALWAIRTVLRNKKSCGHSCGSCQKQCPMADSKKKRQDHKK